MADDLIRRRVTVEGRVQGVFFRDSTRAEAERHGVAGWICNRSDGAVEAVLEGAQEAVRRVLSFLESGPPRASVEHVEVREETPEGLRRFEVR
jgi:acylphosphatase